MKFKHLEIQVQRDPVLAAGKATKTMKIALRYRGLNARANWQMLVETQLKKLRDLARIASAQVILEWQREVKPGYRVLAHLEVPGPDYHAEAQDYTVPAALLKVVKNLEQQIRSRKSRRSDRLKTNLQLGLAPNRWSMAPAGRGI